MRCIARLVIALCAAVIGLQMAPASAEKRVALVIGNSAYQHTRPLPNPKSDAEAIARLLGENGFADVTLKSDLDYRTMREVVRSFGEAAREADIALVYYGGHGIEVAGENYLVPVDAKLVRDTDLEYEAVTLGSVLSAVGSARRLRLVILDACRNNPLGQSISLGAGATRTVTRGLARIEPKGDMLVAYAARAGTLAQDGKGRHSPYAEALLKHMMTPGLDVRVMFGKVRDQVLLATSREQEPFIYGSLSGEVIPLVPNAPAAKAPSAAAAPAPKAVPASEAAEAWDRAKDSTSVGVLEAFRRQYGGSNAFYDRLAEARIAELRKQQTAMLKAEEDRKRTEAEKKRTEGAEAEAAKRKTEEEAQARAKAAAFDRGYEHFKKKDFDRAIADYGEAIRLNPSFAQAYDGRGSAYRYKGDFDRAIADYSVAIRLDPSFAQAYDGRGSAYRDKGDFDRAITDLNEAIRLNPSSARAYHDRGTTYYYKENFDRAIADYSVAIRLEPNFAHAYYSRGTAYRRKGDFNRAIADLNEAIRLEPGVAAAYHNRGRTLETLGRRQEAIADYRRALSLNPNLELSRKQLRMLGAAP
jgi:uncharacterized caspase-like protein